MKIWLTKRGDDDNSKTEMVKRRPINSNINKKAKKTKRVRRWHGPFVDCIKMNRYVVVSMYIASPTCPSLCVVGIELSSLALGVDVENNRAASSVTFREGK